MARQDVLIIGLDYNSLRILEVSLRKSGFMVASVTNYSDAIEQIKIATPDLVIIDSTRDAEAFEFASSLKTEYKNIPVIIISSNKDINTRIRALEIGIDDYLIKPIYIKEIIARIKIHLQKQEQKRVEEGITAGFIGSLSDIGLYDIIQTIELNRKSGILEVKGKMQDGRIFFKNGKIVQANVGKLRGEYAIYRMLTFSEGIFKMSFLDIDIEPEISRSNSEIIMEGMRRLDEYMKYTEQLPPLTTRLDVDSNLLAQRLKDIPDNVNKVLKLIDSERSINDIVEMSELDDLETLKIISALYFDGIVYDIFSNKTSIEDNKKISSTLPEPRFDMAFQPTKSLKEEEKRPDTSETWVANVFEKEIKDNLASAQFNGGSIATSESRRADERFKEESPKEQDEKVNEKKAEKVESADLNTSEDAREVDSTLQVKSDNASTESSIISSGIENKSPKEQLIETTLIDNVTLSTSSYVKGSLLGKKDKDIKSQRKSRSPIAILIIIILIAGALIYYVYNRYIHQGSLINTKMLVEKRTDIATEKITQKENIIGDAKSDVKRPEEKGMRINREDSQEVALEIKVNNEAELPEKEEVVPQEGTNSAGKVDRSNKTEDKKIKTQEEKRKTPEFEVDMVGYNNFLSSAEKLYKSGNLNGAKEELKQALIRNPKGFEALTLLGQIDLDGNKVRSAITYFKRAINYNNKYAPAYFYLGTCYQLEGNNDIAKKMYQKYLLLAPKGEFANDVKAIISDLK